MSDETGIDIGHGVRIIIDADDGGLLWQHPGHKAWSWLRFMPDPKSTGHVRTAGGLSNPGALTIQGSLLCPAGCGAHGFIREGKWVPA